MVLEPMVKILEYKKKALKMQGKRWRKVAFEEDEDVDSSV